MLEHSDKNVISLLDVINTVLNGSGFYKSSANASPFDKTTAL
jgi:hypothetical protein